MRGRSLPCNVHRVGRMWCGKPSTVTSAADGSTPRPTVFSCSEAATPPVAEADAPADVLRNAVAQRNPEDEADRVIWRGGYSPKAMIGGWAFSVLIDLAMIVVGVFAGFGLHGWLILILLMALPWLYHAALLCYRCMNVRYSLSTQSFVHESGVVRRVIDRIEVLDMDDISFEQGLLERLVGVGSIRIVSSDRSHPELLMPGIENARHVARTVRRSAPLRTPAATVCTSNRFNANQDRE